MQEIEQVIGTIKLQAEHPELFHYSKSEVLRPVVESNMLWATHFNDLGDAKEISVLKLSLLDLL